MIPDAINLWCWKLTKCFFLDQHGCAKNQVDGELIIGILTEIGWYRTLEPEKAALIIVNSCGFIEPAKRESIEAVVTARTAYPQAKILLAGCLAERYGEVFTTEFEEADAFFGNGDLSQLPVLIAQLFPQKSQGNGNTSIKAAAQQPKLRLRQAGKQPFAPSGHPFLKPAQEGVCCGPRPELLNFPRSVFIKITEGCNNCCSFCAIPLIRGSVRSRPLSSIVAEIQEFVQRGCREFNLIGQDLAVYETSACSHRLPLTTSPSSLKQQTDIVSLSQTPAKPQQERSGLAQLLTAISGITGAFKIRLLYIHPDHFPLDILPVMISDSRFLPYFDIPFQSGSSSIIRAMNRSGSAESYLRLAETIRAAFRDAKSPYGEAVIRTTFLTGFPGETQDDFDRTAAFLNALQSLWSGAFAYSQEEGTQAACMKKKVPAKIAEQRKTALNELQLSITEKKLAGFCGQEMDILIEEVIPPALKDTASMHSNAGGFEAEHADEYRIALGRAWFQAPEVDGAVVVNFSQMQKDSEGNPITAGSLVRVRITALRGIDLEADAL